MKMKMLIHNTALPFIRSSLEVRQISKIRTVQKPDVLDPGRRIFINRKKNLEKKYYFFFKFFRVFHLFV